MARKERRKPKKTDHSRRMSQLKAKALVQVAQRDWNNNLRHKTIPLLLDALRRDPKNPEILLKLATACGKQRFYDKAEQYLARCLELAPRKASIYRLVAQTYASIERPERAVECFRRSLELNRDTAATVSTLLELAQMYERFHRLDEARAVVDEALQRDPDNENGQLQRAILDRRCGSAAEAEAAFRALATNKARTRHIRVMAWYELAQLFDDQGRYDDAFQALVAAKQLMEPFAREFREFSQMTLARNKLLLDSFDKGTYERWMAAAENDSAYRFAVLTSHPRSGTTLIEQVLDSHDQLISADEHDVFTEWVQNPILRRFPRSAPVLAILDRVPPAVRQQVRAAYWQQTEAIFDEPIGARMLLDKNPGMTIQLPMLNWAFPEVKMLIAIRDPRDVVLSCFMQKVPLTPIGSNWLNLPDAAEFYARAMETWLKVRELTPSPWLEFRYEDVVANLEGEARKILDFLGLPWDERVLKFYEHAREKLVRSPTYKDVTQPVYNKSVGRWKNYARHFEPILEKLQPFVREFGYQ